MESTTAAASRKAAFRNKSQLVSSRAGALHRLARLESAGWQLSSLREGEVALDLSSSPGHEDLPALAGLAGFLASSGFSLRAFDDGSIGIEARSISPRCDALMLSLALFIVSGVRAGSEGGSGRGLLVLGGCKGSVSGCLARLHFVEDRLLWLRANAALLEAEGNRLERLARAFELDYGELSGGLA